MKRVAVIQARMGSARLPGKVLAEVAGQPLLAHQLRRLQACPSVDEIVVATTDATEDDAIATAARQSGARVYRGSSSDVLGRVLQAAADAGAEVVVRLTGDCPLIDPGVTARVVDEVAEGVGVDYASNVLARTYPRGLDVEAMTFDALEAMDRISETPAEREHVTLAARSTHPALFTARSVTDDVDNSDLRWTVDEPADLRLMELLFDRLDLATRIVPYREIVAAQRADPALLAVNRGIQTWTPGHEPVATPPR